MFRSKLRKMHTMFWQNQNYAEYQSKAMKVMAKFPYLSMITNHKTVSRDLLIWKILFDNT